MGSKFPDPQGFVGFVSDVPIAFTLNTRDSSFEGIHSHEFVPVSEPGTLALLGLVALAIIRRR